MPGPSREIQLRLYRDALSTPWGFRLQGGKDVKQPLTVQKVTVGSPVDGELLRGDVLLEIQNCDATQLTHLKAQEFIKNAGGSLLLRIRRSGYHDPQSSVPAPATGTALPGQQAFMLHRLQDTLSNLSLQPRGYDPGYSSATQLQSHWLNDHHSTYPRVQQYNSPQSVTPRPSTYPDRMYSTLPKPMSHQQQQVPIGLAEPGWTPGLTAGQHRPTVAHSRSKQYPRQSPRAALAPPITRPRSLEPEEPAWVGSLRSSHDPHLTDMRLEIQPAAIGLSRSTEIARFSPAVASPAESGSYPFGSSPRMSLDSESSSARVFNLQYNSPMGLYSRAAAAETLRSQTYAKSGFGGTSQ